MKTVAEMDSWVLYVLLFLLCFIAAWCLLKIMTSIEKMRSSFGKRGPTSHYIGCFFIIILLTLTTILLEIAALSNAFFPYEFDKPIAAIKLKPAESQRAILSITYPHDPRSDMPSTQSVKIKTTAWTLTGETLTWNKLLSTLGLRPMYRLITIRSAPSTGAQPHHYSLAEHNDTRLFRSALQMNKICRFARISSLSAPEQPIQYHQTWSLYITPKGLQVIRRHDAAGTTSSSGEPPPQAAAPGNRTKYPSKEEHIKR